MQKLINNFLEEISEAIAVYGEEAKPLSHQRQIEIQKLKTELSLPRADLSEYISIVKNFLPRIKTGTRFFETGNSRFKEALERKLNFYNNPVVILLMRMEKEYRNKKGHFMNYLQKLTVFIEQMKSSEKSTKDFNSVEETPKVKMNYSVMLGFRR